MSDFETFTYNRHKWYWHKASDVEINATSWTKSVYAPSVEIAKAELDDFFRRAKKFHMQPPRQKFTVKHGNVYYNTPSAISLSDGHGFHYDSIYDLFVEDDLAVGDHVFAVCAQWEDWGGTFGENERRTSIVALTKDNNIAKEITEFLTEFGNVEVDKSYDTGAVYYMPWHGYGCQFHDAQILYLPVTE